MTRIYFHDKKKLFTWKEIFIFMKKNIYLREKNVEKTVNGVGDKPLQSMD